MSASELRFWKSFIDDEVGILRGARGGFLFVVIRTEIPQGNKYRSIFLLTKSHSINPIKPRVVQASKAQGADSFPPQYFLIEWLNLIETWHNVKSNLYEHFGAKILCVTSLLLV